MMAALKETARKSLQKCFKQWYYWQKCAMAEGNYFEHGV
jgi:hypothetical protein